MGRRWGISDMKKKILLTCLWRGFTFSLLRYAAVEGCGLWCWRLSRLVVPGVLGMVVRTRCTGVARPPAIALLNLAFSGGRCAKVHPGETLLKLVIVANAADYWGGFTGRSEHTCGENLRQTTKVMRLCVWGERINTISQGQCADAARLRGLSPAVQNFNKSDTSDLGKLFNSCFLSGFQHCVGGWSNATGQGRALWCTLLQMDVSAEQQTLSWIPVQESIRLGRAVYLHNASKWFAQGKRLV